MLCLLASIALASVAPAAPDGGLLSLIQEKEASWAASLDRGDVDALAAMYDNDAELVLPGSEAIIGRADIRAVLQGMARQTAHLRLRTISVRRLGQDYLVEDGVSHSRPKDVATSTEMTANYVVLWHHTRGGQWRILRDVVSPS
jgi:uncharacterized protein (TIGR02246 family)